MNLNETFTMVDDKLLSTSISIINPQQKLFISWILRFQKNNLECFASTKHIGETLGMSKDGAKSLIKSCSNKFKSFFSCVPYVRDNGVPYHIISIDLDELIKFINTSSTEKEEITEEIIPQPIQSIQEDIKVPEIKEKQYDDSFFPDFLKQESYTDEEYQSAIDYLKSPIYNYKPKPKKIHQDNILNNIEL